MLAEILVIKHNALHILPIPLLFVWFILKAREQVIILYSVEFVSAEFQKTVTVL